MATREQNLVVGGLYACIGDDRLWRVVKILACARKTVYVRIYTNRFKARPKSIDPDTLSLAMTLEDLNKKNIPFGISCLPVDRRGFESEERFYLGSFHVTQEELDELSVASSESSSGKD